MILADKIYGLVLTGGHSTRMGSDKGLIDYHGQPQRDYLFHLLKQVCGEVYYSIRKDQRDAFLRKNVIIDVEEIKGPLAGMISAYNSYPNVAWLVLACDLPFVDIKSITELIQGRDSSKYSTAYAVDQDSLPEPLFAIWEPRGLHAASDFVLNKSISCPRKVLMNCDIKLVFPDREYLLLNANSQEDFLFAKKKIANDGF